MHLAAVGLSTLPYPRERDVQGFIPHASEGPEALRPYRDVEPSRLKISGDGAWPLANFLGPELKLAYLDPLRTKQLLKLWALVIDDYFVVSAEKASTPPAHSEATRRVLRAKEVYKSAQVKGSDHKDVLGAEVFQAAGAQIDSSALTRSYGNVLVSAPTGKLLALSVISLKTAALCSISEELASNLAGSWIAALMFRRCLFSVLDGFFALGKAESAGTAGSRLRPLSRKDAQELVLLASLAPVVSSNVSAEFSPTIFCSDSSSTHGAFCSCSQPPELTASVWLSADRKGSYTMLSSPKTACVAGDPAALEDPLGEGLLTKPSAFDFDVLCLLEGSASIAQACLELGAKASPVIDTKHSGEYDLFSPAVGGWISHLLWSARARSFVAVLPSGTWNERGNLKPSRKAGRKSLALKVVSFFRIAVRAGRPALLLAPASSGLFSLPEAQSLLKVEGVRLLQPGTPGSNESPQDPACHPGILFTVGPPPKEFSRSRSLAGLSAFGVAQCLFELTGQPQDPLPSPGFENVVTNDVLITGSWKVDSVWAWEKQRHINALEAEAGVSVLRELVRKGGDCRSVLVLDSSCAREALAKGRSSAKLLRPSLRRAASLTIGGGLYPAFVFGPTRLNASDDATRQVPLRTPCPSSLVEDLDEEAWAQLCNLPGLSKPRANWFRLVLLVSRPQHRKLLVQAIDDFPSRACPSVVPLHLYDPLPLPGCAAEEFAAKALQQGLFQPSVLSGLLELLPAAGKVRFEHQGQVKVWTSGLYSQGPFKGVRSAAEKFPTATRLACMVVRAIDPSFAFSSISLLRDLKSLPHKDRNNLRGSASLVFAVSSFEGGDIWVEGGKEDCEAEVGGKVLLGAKVDFDSTLGFPGEGPRALLFILAATLLLHGFPAALLGPRNAADRARTGSYRASLVAAFSQWMLEVMGLDLQTLLDRKPLDAEIISEALVRYGRDLYGSGRPYWHYSETINSVTSLKPVLRRQVQAAWDLGFAWVADEPYSHHTAIPPAVLIATITACLLWGWTREAGCFALAFGGVMRIGEVLKTRRRNLILPEDVAYSQHFILVQIEEPKTRGRGAKHQAAKVEAVDLIKVISLAFARLKRDEKLWPMSPQTLRKRFDLALHRVGASPPPPSVRALDLGSFRAGGATYMLQQTEDSELVRRRGRWASAKVMEIYLQEITASTFLPSLPQRQKERIFGVAAGFSVVLAQAVQWYKDYVPNNAWFRLWTIPAATILVCRFHPVLIVSAIGMARCTCISAKRLREAGEVLQSHSLQLQESQSYFCALSELQLVAQFRLGVFLMEVWKRGATFDVLPDGSSRLHVPPVQEKYQYLAPATVAFLWQFPPSFVYSDELYQRFERLVEFLSQEGSGIAKARHIVDFRDGSWYRQDVYDFLRQKRWCLAWLHLNNATGWASNLPSGWTDRVQTTNFCFCRLFGPDGQTHGTYDNKFLH
ncbi:unnamed protein product, partial [Symbiodinium necroappetens]